MREPKLNPKHLKALAKLASTEEYKILKFLCENMIFNCMVDAMKVPPNNPNFLIAKTSEYKGAIIALKRVIKQIENASKRLEKLEEKND